jgi:hypothetical protein
MVGVGTALGLFCGVAHLNGEDIFGDFLGFFSAGILMGATLIPPVILPLLAGGIGAFSAATMAFPIVIGILLGTLAVVCLLQLAKDMRV